ncbi:MAG: LssY C-terminal domain-containing protein [Candidatus Omnitrophica bacterium]|nr:LssY C-terminal domain-containing protein [Candidatus Omnitrophota bacterium]MDD5671713.1 LssY C-terminal domain-containing protein [Candidatus Omnitrophota bacterium]
MRTLSKRTLDSFIVFLALSLIASGCVTYKPHAPSETPFMERAQTQTDGQVRVTAAVLSDKESKKIFGVAVAKKGIQPVWLEIENKEAIPYIFVPRSVDPNYYSYEEAAYRSHLKKMKYFVEYGILGILFFPLLLGIPINMLNVNSKNKKMDRFFKEQAFRQKVIMPGEKGAGFIFVTLDEGTKIVPLELFSSKGVRNFRFTINVPGVTPDYTTKDYEAHYAEEKIENYDDEGLYQALLKMPCCTTNKKGNKYGDPLNVVMIGDIENVVAVLATARWDQTESLSVRSGTAMAKALFTGGENRYSPISPLYFDGRSQDVSFQKARETINERLHMRLWYTPLRYHSKPVWLGTISRDIGVRMTWRTWYFTTHKIDSDIDDARDYLLADLASASNVAHYGFIRIGHAVPPSHPFKNLTGDPYFTDDLRIVLDISPQDVPMTTFPWEHSIEDVSADKA